MKIKAQVAVSMTLAMLVLLLFVMEIAFQYLHASRNTYQSSINKIESDLDKISFCFDSYGYPADWYDSVYNVADIKRIGMLDADGSNAVDLRKIERFDSLSPARKKLGISSNYLFYFDLGGKLKSINGKCSYGDDVNLVKDSAQQDKTLYFYHTSGYIKGGIESYETFIENKASGSFIDLYETGAMNCNSVPDSTTSYKNLILENIHCGYDDIGIRLKYFLLDGGTIVMGGELLTDNRDNFIGVNWRKETDSDDDASGSDDHITATVESDDNLLYLGNTVDLDHNPGGDYYYIEKDETDTNVKNFEIIARFDDGKIAAAKWEYGDGRVYYFSNLNLNSNGFDELKYLIYNFIDVKCDFKEPNGAKNILKESRIIKVPSYNTYKTYNLRMISWD